MKYSNARRTVLLVTVLLSAVIDLGASWALERVDLGSTARFAVALAPIPAKIAVIALILQAIRRLDDFQKRVHFEAVTVAFLSTGVAVIVYGYLEKAQAAGPLNVGLVWTFMVCFYAIGYFTAKVHYK
ncbi:MAG TPA: hypothetical protein VJN43_20385 [Bryobacteraceae bacterium]|nr:hypothetical protein [Bryobacteraceae bacterium]